VFHPSASEEDSHHDNHLHEESSAALDTYSSEDAGSDILASNEY
jgi:hypothetical protein